MPGGTLIQLLAVGAQNTSIPVRNIAHEYHIYESEGLQPITISKLADIAKLEYLELIFTEQWHPRYLDDIKKLVLDMEIGGQIIQQFPLSLLINLNEPIICHEKLYINLCFDMLFGNIKLTGLQSHEVKVKIRSNTVVNCISNYGIVSKLTYLDIDERRDIAQNPHEEFIQQISFINVMTDLNDINQTSNIYDLNNLPFSNVSKGFFIECNNVDYLNNIYIKFNGQDRFNLNNFLVRTKCKKINQHLLYFPFNYDMNFSDRTASSYEGAANLSRIDAVDLKLTFDFPINNVKIYCLHSNIYRQMSGMGSLRYIPSLHSNTYDLHNNRLPSHEPIIINSIIRRTVGTSIVYTGPSNKLITDRDTSNCPISYEPIDAGGRYMCCHQCENNFSESALKQWLEGRRAEHRTCPLCRVQWSNFEIYINSENSEQSTNDNINVLPRRSLPFERLTDDHYFVFRNRT